MTIKKPDQNEHSETARIRVNPAEFDQLADIIEEAAAGQREAVLAADIHAKSFYAGVKMATEVLRAMAQNVRNRGADDAR